MKKFALVLVLPLFFGPVLAHARSVGGANPLPQSNSIGGANPLPQTMSDWTIDLITFLQIM